MKKVFNFLFTRNDKLGGTAPIYLVVLGVVVIFALYYFLFMGKEDSTPKKPETPNTNEVSEDSSEKESFFSKLAFWKKDGEEGDKSSKSGDQATQADSSFSKYEVPSDLLLLDDNLLSEDSKPKPVEPVIEEGSKSFGDFNAEKVEIKNVGRRDPMRTIVGKNVGTLDLNRADYDPADLKDESKNYFGGISIEEIVLDYISVDELGDSKARADFIINGSYIPNLQAGDYLLELYYVRKIDTVKKEVQLVHQDKIYILSEENIYFKDITYEAGSGNSSSNSGKDSGNNSK